MKRTRHTPEQIVRKLREADRLLAENTPLAEVMRSGRHIVLAMGSLSFPPKAFELLGFYVYRLVDPRNGETFYVGKGKGNRVFQHIQEQIDSDNPEDKLKVIRDIKHAGLEVGHIIHRHGMEEKVAFEVEAALIDAYPGLTNIQGGVDSAARGSMHASEFIRQFEAKAAHFRHRVMMVNFSRSNLEMSAYEAIRFAWKASISKARKAELVLGVDRGVIHEVFVPVKWLEATDANFPGRETVAGRIGFEGVEAEQKVKNLYVGHRIPDEFRKRGAANPIRYNY